MSFFEFPHTRTYDSDLGWLIKTMKEIESEVENLLSWMNTHKEEYKEINRRVSNLERKIDAFEREIERRFQDLKTELSEEIYTQIQTALSEINRLLGDMSSQIASLRSDLSRAILDLDSLMMANDEYIKEYIEARLQIFIDSIPDLTTVHVFNPVRGEDTDIQTAINDLYEIGRSEALTAAEYDAIGLTASEYDALDLTALEYDMYGLYLIERAGYIKNPFHYMSSPFTGEYVPLEVVISELAALHRDDALTASEYDALAIDADYYDALDLSAYDYDWHGKTLVA